MIFDVHNFLHFQRTLRVRNQQIEQLLKLIAYYTILRIDIRDLSFQYLH